MTRSQRLRDDDVTGFFAGRLPDGWFDGAPEVSIDREEILVVGRLSEPSYPEGANDSTKETAQAARIKGFREDTREKRMRIASEAERVFGRTVSWGARCGEAERLFTTVGAPVMTRLRMEERGVLDTLIEGGVARSRSEALAWCVRLVARHEADWINDLRDALTHVQRVRTEGPEAI